MRGIASMVHAIELASSPRRTAATRQKSHCRPAAPSPFSGLLASMSAPSRSRPVLHPLVASCLMLIAARALGLFVHYFSADANGNAIAASPLNSLIVAGPYHGAFIFSLCGLLLLLWKLLPPLRAGVTMLGVVLSLSCIVVGQIDFGLQWFIGQRFSPMIGGTYLGRNLFSSDLYAPVLHHPWYLVLALCVMFMPVAVVARSLQARWRAQPIEPPAWRTITGLLVLACLCFIPVHLAYGHQRDVLRPPELIFAYHWLFSSEVPAPKDEAAAFAQLRATIDPSGKSVWRTDRYPAVRATPVARNRYLAGKPAEIMPDVFLFSVESLRGADVGYVPGNYAAGEATPTPHLDRLAQRGVVFTHYIASGNPTPRGFFGINGGVWDHRGSFIISTHADIETDSLPERLRRAGYFNLGLWGANPSFDNQLHWANQWFHRVRHPLPTGKLLIMRPLADDRLMDQLIEEIEAHDATHADQPLFAYIANADTHLPYRIDGETGMSATAIDAINSEPDTRQRARRVLRHTDEQIGRVLRFLATRRSSRPHLIIVVGDHSDVAGEIVPPEMRGLPNNAVVWTSALIAGPSSIVGPVPRIESFPASHPDLTPTLLSIVGDRDDTVATGSDLFADIDEEQRSAIAISGQGYRLDRGGWSCFVRRDDPNAIWSKPSFTGDLKVQAGLEGSPFSPTEVRSLWQSIDTWSYLIEHDRIWRRALLKPTQEKN